MSARGQPRRVSTVGTGRMVRVRRWPRAGRCAARPSRRGGLWVIERKLTTWRVADFRGVFVQKLVGALRARSPIPLAREETCRRPSPPSRSRHGARRAARRVRATRRPRAYRPGTPTLRRDPSRAVVPVTRSCFVDIRPARPEPPQLCRPRARARGSGTTPSGSGRSTACPRSSRARRERGTPGTAPRPRSRVPGT